MTAAKTNGTAPKGLHAKLAEVMDAISFVKKGGRNEAQKYDYTRQADVTHAVRTELSSRKVTCVPTTIDVIESRDYESKSGGRQHFLLIRIDWTFTDAETGETLVVTSLGAGTDSGDKSPYKAMTGASKYAELLSFLIPTGDDPEKDAPGSERASTTGAETLELIGVDTASGVIQKGGAQRYQVEWRETPTGPVIGFALKRNGDKDFPQVGLMGDVAAAVYASGDFPQGAELIGQKVRFRGRFYNVRQTGRASYTRVIVGQGDGDFLETDDWRFPAPVTDDNLATGHEHRDDPAEPPEAPSAPLWDGLTDEEKELIAAGAPDRA